MKSNEGKLIWGTSRYRLIIKLEEPVFDVEMKGKITLMDRRFAEEELTFANAQEFIESFKTLWSKALNREIQEAQYSRLARWIEEFFQEEYGISVDFQSILNFIRSGTIAQRSKKEELEIEEAPISKETISNFLTVPEDVEPEAIKLTIKEEISSDVIEDIIDEIFQKEAPREVPLKIKTTISFKDEEGNERNIEQSSSVVPPLGGNNFKLTSGFKNPTKGFIKDIQLTDIIPFDYQIKNIASNDIPNTSHEKNVTPKGLLIKWNIPLLAEGQNFEAKYDLGLRITRYIVAQLPEELVKIKTYEPIIEEDGYFKVSPVFINSYEHPIKKLRIADFIPRIYKLVEIEPEPQEPFGKLVFKSGMMEAIWNHENISPGTTIERYYELEHAPTFYRTILYLFPKTKELNPLVIGRVFYPNADGITVFYQILNQDLNIKNLIIKDSFPKNLDIELNTSNEKTALLEDEESKIILLGDLDLNPKDNLTINVTIKGELDIEPHPILVIHNDKPILLTLENKAQFTEKHVL